MDDINLNKNLIELAYAKMPFGKYQGRFLVDIPEPYYVWYKNKGFPAGKLGQQLASMYEIKVNGKISCWEISVERA